MKTIKEVFDHHLSHVRFDSNLLKKIRNFQQYFITKNDDHMHFFAEPYIGVYKMTWSALETDMWFQDILEVDEDALQDDYLDLPSINPSFEISSKSINMLFLYLIHRFDNSPLVKEKEAMEAKILLMSILNYRFLSSLLFRNFSKFLTPKEEAVETYNRLSRQFDIKKYRSWGKLVEVRATDLVNPHGTFGKIIKYFDDDYRLVQFVNDIQGRMSSTLKPIMQTLVDIRDEGKKLQSTSSTMILDEGTVVKDLVRMQTSYIRYIQRIITDKETFIKQELVDVIVGSMKSIDEEFFATLLPYLCEHYDDKKVSFIQKAIQDLLIYTFELMKAEGLNEKDSFKIANMIRKNFMAGRVNDPMLTGVKKAFDKLIHTCQPKSKRMVITSERVSMMMYIVLRALFMRHYND